MGRVVEEKAEQMARAGGVFITFGKAASGGLEAHKKLSEISLQITLDKPHRVKKDD